MRNRPAAVGRPALPPIEHVSVTAATSGLPAGAYRAGLKWCAQTGEWRAALQLLDRLAAIYDSAPPHSPSYANAMLACRRGGVWSVALRLMTELQERGGRLDAFVASNAIAACEPAGRWEQALAILRALEVTEVPNTVCVNAAISACASGGRWREALALLEAMEVHTRTLTLTPTLTLTLALTRTRTLTIPRPRTRAPTPRRSRRATGAARGPTRSRSLRRSSPSGRRSPPYLPSISPLSPLFEALEPERQAP